ncbi:MAG TPA: sugar ABC transporter substrate-binding protein [Gaiellaceae bacterium]|nr:sugar ABC transporter substrate-binding protein [Gaiellaceae bacterium]
MKLVTSGRRVAFGASLAAVLAAAVAVPSLSFAGTSGKAAKQSIVWLELGSGNPYWDAQHQAANTYLRSLGFSFKSVSGQGKPESQSATLRQLADQGVNVVMLNPVDPKALVPAVKYARSKGTKVLSVYAEMPAANASVVFDEIRSGRVAGEYALDLLKQRYGKVSGKVAVLEGILGQPASDLRAKGFVDYMKKQGVDIVATQPTDWTADKASATMQDWLVKYPDLSMVYGLSDTITVPAVNVAERQNRLCTQEKAWSSNPSCIAFVSVDGIFLNEVVKGRLFSTELYSPYWTGYAFSKFAVDLAKGKKVEKLNMVDSLLVTPKNASCVTKMATDMQKKLKTFPFVGSLQTIARTKYHCAVVDAGA